ncbi:MAG TPA: OB-fold nucleic acid binding domain-containing protein, partial [Opitutaceae bacterium]|nr:OB-fold nucleic acid binding domain-containing protein [Opitutaceae bacterium]
MKRTHHCAQLNKADLGASVALAGWVDSIRDHGGILFIDLRDRKGVTQVKFDPHVNKELAAQAAQVKPESVISAAGKVVPRPEGTINSALPTGEIEVDATGLEILNLSETPPFPL